MTWFKIRLAVHVVDLTKKIVIESDDYREWPLCAVIVVL